MLSVFEKFGRKDEDGSTINVKRTTLATAGIIILVVISAMVLLAFYASFKALSAASAVDEAWQTQLQRIENIEAKAIQASADAQTVKKGHTEIQQGLLVAGNRISEMKQAVDQATSYRETVAAMEADKAALQAKAQVAKAEAEKATEAAEQKGVENFDRLLLARLRGHWSRPASVNAGLAVDVVVQFAADGTITNAVVPKTSGSQDLDDSVVKAAADLAKIPEMATVSRPIYLKYLQQRSVRFEL